MVMLSTHGDMMAIYHGTLTACCLLYSLKLLL